MSLSLSESLSAVLIDPQQVIAQLNAEIAQRDTELTYLKKKLIDANSHGAVVKAIVKDLYEKKHGESLPKDADYDDMYERVCELVAEDEDERWNPEREFSVVIYFKGTITGTVLARSADEAHDKVNDDLPTIMIGDEAPLSDSDMDYDVKSVEVSE